MPDAAEVQTASWDLDVDLGDCCATTVQAVRIPVPDMQQQVDIIHLSAVMAYLRLYQHPGDDVEQIPAMSGFSMRDDALHCVCCGALASVDEVGFCTACVEVAEPI
ncbi:MAG: hypothetical protein WC100_16655 [Sterolibacterium sp.]